MVFKDLYKLEGDKFLSYLLILLSLFIPGIGYLYLTNNLLTLPWIQMIFISVFFSLPLFILALFNSTHYFKKELDKIKKKEDFFVSLILVSSLLALVFFYFSLVFFYLFLSQGIKMNIIIFIYGLPSLFFLWGGIKDLFKELKNKK